MTINQLTAKQIAEMSDLQDMQGKDIETMTKRHDRERQFNPSPYFEQRREKQMNELKQRHVLERARMVELHEKEYQDVAAIRSILHNAEKTDKAEQMEMDLRAKEKEEEPEQKKTIVEIVRDLVQQKLKIKNRQQGM